MRRNRQGWALKIAGVLSLLAIPLSAGSAWAQGYGGPLTIQGLHHQSNPSAASRAFGGVTMGTGSDISLMFSYPASMRGLDGLQISVAGSWRSQDLSQVQQYAPVRYYPNLSLLLESMTDEIPDPDPNLVGFTPADSVQRPYDDIQPNWSRSSTTNRPLHALLAVPFTLGKVRFAAGLGAVQYANLNHYYQNNNVLDPAVLSQRPLPTLRPTDDNPVTVDWYQTSRSREGSIYGYGIALAGHIERYNLTLGVSGLLLDGDTDDIEQRVERGQLTFLANEFRVDSLAGRVRQAGSSHFSATEFAFSSVLAGKYVSLGFVLRPPTTFTRTYEREIEADTAGTPFTSTVDGEDRFQLPWRGAVGLLLQPRERLRIGFEYEFRPYSSATFTTDAGVETLPWHSASLFRMGMAYEPASWLVVRSGLRGEADVFVPEGSAIEEDPVQYRVFSAGVGLAFKGVRWDIAYEYANMRYDDIWSIAISKNADVRHTLVTDISFTLPVRW